MSDIDLSQLPPPSPDDPPAIRQLRDALERERTAREAAESQLVQGANDRKENAFLKAGVDVESELGKFFFEKYEGELTAEAVKQAADKLGLAPATPPPPPPSDADLERQRLQGQLGGEGTVPPPDPANPTDVNPWDAGYKAFDDRLARGDTREKAAAEVFDRVIDAAANGDQRVIFDPVQWREEYGTR